MNAAITAWHTGAPERPAELLGRKGLLGKEPATRMALCAVHAALGLPAGRRPDARLHTDTAVVACSNLGNVETVAAVARAARTNGIREVSPMAAPNASSNVIASTVALWFGFGGPNLMICSGAPAGLDGLRTAVRLLRAGRAARVVVVGAEPDDEVATAVYGPSLRAGAACVVLEASARGPVRAESVTPYGPPAEGAAHYGAWGVYAVAGAAARVADNAAPVTVTCGSDADGWRSVRVTRAEAAG